MAKSYWIESLGCPKNKVDSEKLEGTLMSSGYSQASTPECADILVVNTCAFIESAREESIATILDLAAAKRKGARLVVTGCMAERYGDELSRAMPEVDSVAGFGVPLDRHSIGEQLVTAGSGESIVTTDIDIEKQDIEKQLPTTQSMTPSMDLLELPRPPHQSPWAYVKIAEGCNRKCGFCAIPSFRGTQRSRSIESIVNEVKSLGPEVREIILVAQDTASWGMDGRTPQQLDSALLDNRTGIGGNSRSVHFKGDLTIGCTDSGIPLGTGSGSGSGSGTYSGRPIIDLIDKLSGTVDILRLLYLYPSSLNEQLIKAICSTGTPYFDMSLQHCSSSLLRRMRRWGNRERFLKIIDSIRSIEPQAILRSSFVVGYPGETENDHEMLMRFLEDASLDWAGFFPFSLEEGTFAQTLDDQVPQDVVMRRTRECSEVQDSIMISRRASQIGRTVTALIDSPGQARSYMEAPEIDGIIHVPPNLQIGSLIPIVITGLQGFDLIGRPAHSTNIKLRTGKALTDSRIL